MKLLSLARFMPRQPKPGMSTSDVEENGFVVIYFESCFRMQEIFVKGSLRKELLRLLSTPASWFRNSFILF